MLPMIPWDTGACPDILHVFFPYCHLTIIKNAKVCLEEASYKLIAASAIRVRVRVREKVGES